MTINTLIERLKEDLDILDKKGGYYEQKSMEAYESGDKDAETYWDNQADEVWRISKDIRMVLLIIKELSP